MTSLQEMALCTDCSWSFLLLCMLGLVPWTSAARPIASIQRRSDTRTGFNVSVSLTSPRVVSIGDLHGDYEAFVEIAYSLDLIDADGFWAGGNTTLVQTGDVMDRGPSAHQLYTTLFRLQDEAPAQGGTVVLLLGNHELLNLMGDWTHVSETDVAAFGGSVARLQALESSGWLGKGLRNRCQTVALIGSTVYVHAGLSLSLIETLVANLDSQSVGGQTVADINSRVASELQGTSETIRRAAVPWLGVDGFFWMREYALGKENITCEDVRRVLATLGAQRMVIGHTPQSGGNVRSRCEGALVLADTQISRYMKGSPRASAVEIVDENLQVIYPPDRQRWPAAPYLRRVSLNAGGTVTRVV